VRCWVGRWRGTFIALFHRPPTKLYVHISSIQLSVCSFRCPSSSGLSCMDSLMTKVANYQGLSPAGSHDAGSSVVVPVLPFPDLLACGRDELVRALAIRTSRMCRQEAVSSVRCVLIFHRSGCDRPGLLVCVAEAGYLRSA
jgi:hypothetical protein